MDKHFKKKKNNDLRREINNYSRKDNDSSYSKKEIINNSKKEINNSSKREINNYSKRDIDNNSKREVSNFSKKGINNNSKKEVKIPIRKDIYNNSRKEKEKNQDKNIIEKKIKDNKSKKENKTLDFKEIMKSLNDKFNACEIISPSTNTKNRNKMKNKNINSYSNSIKLKYRTIIPSVNLYKYKQVSSKDKNNLRTHSGITSNSKKFHYNFGSDINQKTFTELRRHKTVNDFRRHKEKKSPNKLKKNYNNILSKKLKMLKQQMEETQHNSVYLKTENRNSLGNINEEALSKAIKFNSSESQLKIKKKDKSKRFHPAKRNVEMVIDSYAKEGGTFPGLGKEKK